MKSVKPTFKIESPFARRDALRMLRLLEKAGRVCYKSEGATTATSASAFITKLAQVFKHESVIEHCVVSVRFICDRGVSHEIVRHRLAAYSQESTRYCNYCKEKFNGHIQLIHPQGLTKEQRQRREGFYAVTQDLYNKEIEEGLSPQIARGLLPTSLKTEIVMTANLREWRHVFKMRTSEKAHPQMRELMVPLHARFAQVMPELVSEV